MNEPSNELQDMEKDTLREVGNISMGAAATALAALISRQVTITAPDLCIATPEQTRKSFPVPSILVNVSYIKGLNGNNVFILKEEDALRIVAVMMGDPDNPPEAIGEMELSAVEEAMNQMMGMAATALSDLFGYSIEISPPVTKSLNLADKDSSIEFIDEDTQIVQVSFRLKVEDLFDSTLVQIVPLPFARQIAEQLIRSLVQDSDLEETPVEEAVGAEATSDLESTIFGESEDEEIPYPDKGADSWTDTGLRVPVAQERRYDSERLALFRDIPVEIYTILGRTRLPLKELYALGPGAVIELDEYEGEPVELFADGRFLGWGEVVLFNGCFAIKLTGFASDAANVARAALARGRS